jgi:hypothetical protein
MFEEAGRDFQLLAAYHIFNLEGVHQGLSPIMVVRDDIYAVAVFAKLLDSSNPFIELIFCVKIVIALIASGGFPEPVLVVPSMQAHVGKFRIGDDRARFKGISNHGLVDVAETNVVLSEQAEKIGIIPRGMADFQGEGIPRERSEQLCQIIRVSRCIRIRPGKLHEQRCEPVDRDKGLDAELEIFNIFPAVIFSFMGEHLMELDRQKEIGMFTQSLYPGQGNVEGRRPVKCAVDFDDIDIAGEERERVKGPFAFCGIDDSFPIFVAPSGRSDVILHHAHLF